MVRKSGNPHNCILSGISRNLHTQSNDAGVNDHHDTCNSEDSRYINEAASLVTGAEGYQLPIAARRNQPTSEVPIQIHQQKTKHNYTSFNNSQVVQL